MEPIPTKPNAVRATPITRGSKRSRILKEIAAKKAKGRRIDIDLEKLAAALQANDHADAIKRGRMDFVVAVEQLVPVMREMLIQTVLEVMPARIQKTRVQTWFANLPAQPPRAKEHVQHDQPQTSSDADTKAASPSADN